MKKLRNMLISAIAIAAFTTSVFAGNFGVGVTGSVATVGGKGKLAESETGTETEYASIWTYNLVLVYLLLSIQKDTRSKLTLLENSRKKV